MCNTKHGPDIVDVFGLGGIRLGDGDEFRRQAEACRQLAAAALKPKDKDFWMRLAEDWLELARKADALATRH
jgi:hypothetical protein